MKRSTNVPTRIAHRIPTTTADKAALTRLFSTFDLDVTRHAVARKSSNKYRHINLLHRLVTKTCELSGLKILSALLFLCGVPSLLCAASDTMTLAEKAALFEYDLRERFSLDGQVLCKLKLPTGARSFVAYNMPDNAYMTGIHLGTLSMKYAVTGDESVRVEAGKTIRALDFLCTVSGRTGLLARAAWPVDRPKEDDGIWRLSADGAYEWRGDVSTDQMDGVLYGFALAYDLVASESERRVIARNVDALVRHVLDHELRIVGVEGPTRWGNYTRPYVATREPMNALIWLQHLKIAEHVSGQNDFQAPYNRYARSLGYARIAEKARRLSNPLERGRVNHSDDVLLFLAYYPLLRLETDAELLAQYTASLRRAWEGDGTWPGVREEHNPFYAFIAAKFIADSSGVEHGIETLRRFPLDLKWNRDTIRGYEQQFGFTFDAADVGAPGQPGETVPLDHRRKSWSAWVMDPYHSKGSRAQDSSTEFNGHDYLMGYWLGRYLGFISPSD